MIVEDNFQRISKSNNLFVYPVGLFFISIGVFAIFSNIDDLTSICFFSVFIAFFIFLMISQFMTWEIKMLDEFLIFKRGFGTKKYKVNLDTDIVSIDCEVSSNFDSLAIWDSLILNTSIKRFKVSSSSYRKFDELIVEIF